VFWGGSRGVAGCRFAAYRPYVLKTYAATRRWSGDALVDACERLLLEYAGKGLDPQVLIAIRSEVFTIDGPRG
jgi:hypothetical protein